MTTTHAPTRPDVHHRRAGEVLADDVMGIVRMIADEAEDPHPQVVDRLLLSMWRVRKSVIVARRARRRSPGRPS